MAQIFALPKVVPILSSGAPVGSAKLYFYQAGTLVTQNVYTTSALNIAHPQPVQADSAGVFPTIYLNTLALYDYRVQLKTSADVLIYDQDNIPSLINSTIRYDTTGAEGSALITPVNFQYPEGHVYRYATNTTPGTTDMTSAFQSAWKMKNPYAPADTYKITASIPIIANQVGTLDGAIINITGSIKVFTATSVNDWSLLGSFTVVGDNDAAGSLIGTGAALNVTSCNRWQAYNIQAKNIKGWGILIDGVNATPLGDQGRTYGCMADACYIGSESTPTAEYCQHYGFDVTHCDTGVIATAGNTTYIGGNVVQNTVGILLNAGTNHGHGIFSGVNINHNTTAINAASVVNGHSFENCHIYEGLIIFNHSTGIVIRGGIVDFAEVRFQESDGCGFDGCTMEQGYANTITNNYSATNSFAIWRDCVTALGSPFNGAAGNIDGVRCKGSLAGTQTFSPANLAAIATIKLDDTANESANQTTQTAYDCYSAATGVYTAKKGGRSGRAKIRIQIAVTNNAADTGKYQIVLVHSTLGGFYLTPQAMTTTLTYFTLDGELPIDLTQTLTLKIAGTVANNVVLQTADTILFIEGL